MALVSRSQIIGFIEETTDGVLKPLSAGSQFVKMREGASIEGALESIDSDELVAGSIGASKSYTVKEVPTGSFPKYLTHSGVEGQSPAYSILIESALGEMNVNATEYDTVSGSTAGTLSAAATVKVNTGEAASFKVGQCLLIKDATNGYSIRNITAINTSTDVMTLGFNLTVAPGVGVNLGKCIGFRPASGNPSYSVHHWQALTGAGFYQALAGCRTTSMEFSFPANEFAEVNFDMEGTAYYYNPIVISSSNKYIDFTDGVGTVAAILTEKTYKTPIELASEVASKMTAASLPSDADTITCTYSNSTGKYTIASSGTVLSLLWDSGTNTANTAGAALGFSVAADDTGALTYTGDSALSFDTSLTPSYDSVDNIIVKNNQLFIGSFSDNICVKATTASVSVGAPKTDVPSICAESGINESVNLSREVTFSATIPVEKYQARYLDSLLNNTTISIMFNAGPKSNSNWVAGKCFNVFLPSASITASPLSDQDGYQVYNIEAKAFATSSLEDFYCNFI